MKVMFGILAILLSGIGLAGCAAAFVAVWVVRPVVVRTSAETLDAADEGLKFVEVKATRADDLVKGLRGKMEPIAARIIKLADKAERTPAEERELTRTEGELADWLRQVDTIAESVAMAVTLLNKANRISRSLRTPGADPIPAQDALAKLPPKLKELREDLATFRQEKLLEKNVLNKAVRIAREVDEDLMLVDTRVQQLRQQAAQWGTEVAELRTAVPLWTNVAAVLSSVILGWLWLGQFVLMRRAWGWVRPARPVSAG